MLQIQAEPGPKIMPCLGQDLPPRVKLKPAFLYIPWRLRVQDKSWAKRQMALQRWKVQSLYSSQLLTEQPLQFHEPNNPSGKQKPHPLSLSWELSFKEPKGRKAQATGKPCSYCLHHFGSAQTSPKPAYRAMGGCPLLLFFQSTCKIISPGWSHRANVKLNLESSTAVRHPCFKEQSLLFKCRMENGGLHKKCKYWIVYFAHIRFNNYYLF